MTNIPQERTLYYYADHNSCRLVYTLKELIRYSPLTAIVHVDTKSIGQIPHHACKLWYSSTYPPENWLHIFPTGALIDRALLQVHPILNKDDFSVFFYTQKENELYPDYLAMLFFMLSRAEEYGSQKDKIGRFSGSGSFAERAGFLELPVVDIWKTKILQQWFGSAFRLMHQENNCLSVDIDMAYAWKFKPLHRVVLHLIMAAITGNRPFATEIIHTIRGKRQDPYDSYAALKEIAKSADIDMVYFVLCGKRSRLDKNLPIKHKAMQALLSNLSSQNDVGYHPSSNVHRQKRAFWEEKKGLENVLGKRVTKSRMHYLILQLPTTYELLLEAGITEDHSMIFHDKMGYRAGTALPFAWYNLTKEKEEALRIVPYQAMDVTMKTYLKFSAEEACVKIAEMKKEAAKHGLPFRIIWHNSSMESSVFWRGWRPVIDSIFAKKKKDGKS
jgi:hypothetical protein